MVEDKKSALLRGFFKDGVFSLLAFDHRGSLRKTLSEKRGREITPPEITDFKRQIIKALAPFFSGLLVDFEYGLPALKSLSLTSPFILPLEKTGYTESGGERITELEKRASDLEAAGASGMKLLIYANYRVASWQEQKKVMKEALLESGKSRLPLFLEFVLYDAPAVSAGTILENIKSAEESGIYPDVWKVAYPGSPKACQEMSSYLAERPWILLTGGESFEQFFEEYKIAKSFGAKGFLAGRALWQEATGLDLESPAGKEFLEKTLPERFKKLLAA